MKLAETSQDVKYRSITTQQSEGNAPCVQVSYGHISGHYYQSPVLAITSFLEDVEVPFGATIRLRDLSE